VRDDSLKRKGGELPGRKHKSRKKRPGSVAWMQVRSR
jgi:hypothetical protein